MFVSWFSGEDAQLAARFTKFMTKVLYARRASYIRALMVKAKREVSMLSRRRRYCQQCGTGSGSCFQQPGRWFALYIREVVSNRVYHLIPDYGGHKFSTSDRHACGIKSAIFQKRGVLYKQQRI